MPAPPSSKEDHYSNVESHCYCGSRLILTKIHRNVCVASGESESLFLSSTVAYVDATALSPEPFGHQPMTAVTLKMAEQGRDGRSRGLDVSYPP